jgi:hypothetical protein
MSYIIIRGRGCNIVLSVHASNENKSDDTKDSFYEEKEHAFICFPKYHVEICYKSSLKK